MRALLVLCLLAGVAHADGPRTTPYGFDHLVHQRNLDVKGHQAITCARCHVEHKGKLVGKPGHSACFGACHGPAPTAPKRGTKLAFGDREKVCAACHAESLEGTAFTGRLPVAYPPYGFDPDFNITFGHKLHGPIACTTCHDMRSTKPRVAVHERCAGCHDGSAAKTRGPAMSNCVGCHPQAIGKPEPPRLTTVKDSVTSTFSHARHAGRSALGKECTTCHPTIAITDDTQLPRPTMQSCGVSSCHDGKAAFATTAASCTRCHTKAPERYEVHRPSKRFLHAGVHAEVVAERPCGACHALGARGDALIANHEACTQCHADDFAKRNPDKCGACHNASEPWRHLVADRPPPDRTEFGVMIDHDKHPQDCVRCHSLRTSTSQLRPPRGHASCSGAGCHAAKNGPAPTLETCNSCHRNALADARDTARFKAPWSVRATFDHATHRTSPDGKVVECRACHTHLSGADLVTLATPAKATCLPCHDTGKIAFPLTGTTCTKCHPSTR